LQVVIGVVSVTVAIGVIDAACAAAAADDDDDDDA
jgi:hypothetical protein